MMKKRMRICLIAILCVFLTGCSLSTSDEYLRDLQPFKESEKKETVKPSIPEEEMISIPELEHFLGVEELVFEELPYEALEAYFAILVDKYGFVDKNPDMPAGFKTFVHSEAEKHKLYIYAVRKQNDGLVHILMQYSDYCREEKLETWDGSIDKYLHNPEHWVPCDICGGTDDCKTCDGSGYLWEFWWDSTRDCPDCEDGACSECYSGRVRIKLWDEMTFEEKMDTDWQKAAKEMFESNDGK